MTEGGSALQGPQGAAKAYAERAATFRESTIRLGRSSRTVSNLRGLAFVVGLAALLKNTFGEASLVVTVVAIIGFASFVLLIVFHARVLKQEDHALRLLRVNLDATLRLEGRWADLREDGARFQNDTHGYSSDLDLFGVGSLFQRLGVARTRFGQEALARFLREPAAPDVIVERQVAARTLAPRLVDRQELEALALAVAERPAERPASRKSGSAEPPDPEPLLAWAEGPPRFSEKPIMTVVALGLPVVTLLFVFGATVLGWPALGWALPLALQIAVIAGTRSTTDRVFAAVSSTQGAFLRYGPMFELIEGIEGDSTLLAKLRGSLGTGPVRPSLAMRRFERIVGWFELRHNGLVHPFVNALLLWDLNCVLRLEAWQKSAGAHARAWFVTLGEVEALSSFAGLAFDEPLYAWPRVDDRPAHFEAIGLGHPLIPTSSRVGNDVELREPGHALLVTGSNMSGKSTLLRAMGVAAVLAQAGAPVCAAELRMSRLVVRTSLKISDSLARGVSHFYAEVARLKAVVDATSGELPVLFLLDEVLHGTNSSERQVGARWVLGELLQKGAIGAVSTHDAALCELSPDLMGRVRQCHFRESVENSQMTFDYRLRPGPVQGGNALRLMRLVGLEVPLSGEQG